MHYLYKDIFYLWEEGKGGAHNLDILCNNRNFSASPLYFQEPRFHILSEATLRVYQSPTSLLARSCRRLGRRDFDQRDDERVGFKIRRGMAGKSWDI